MAVILPSVYRDGTATVAAGGTAVTGQGTLFLNSVLPGDFFGVHKGTPIRIASVESNTALTLANPWPGAAQTAAAYEIMLQSDMARVQESTRQLLVKLLGGNIDAFAGLIGEADKVPYFNGAGTMTLANFKVKGRAVLDSETMPVLLSRLGPTGSRPSPAPSAADVSLTDGDFNTITYPGMYMISGTWSNGPSIFGASPSYSGSTLEVIVNGTQTGYWQYFRTQTTTWVRAATSASGLSSATWRKIEHSMTGSVAQSSGVPTGSIFERGSNGNGEYVKMADGTLICTHAMDISGIAVATPRGSIFGFASESLWTHPAAFVGTTPRMSYEFGRGDVAYTGGGSSITKTLTSTTFVVWNSSSNPAGNNKTIYVTAIGRWF